MKSILLAVALMSLTGPAIAGANFEPKESKSKGSCVGVASSSGTGNGAVVGGNGTIGGQPLPESGGGSDQTTSPGSRAREVQAIKENCPER